jgi:sugar lactone lactonase YvrE
MTRITVLLAALLLAAGCATTPEVTPWRADALLPPLPATCPGPADAAPETSPALPLVPGGLAVVRSEGRDIVIVAARSCVMTVDAATGEAEALPTHGDAIAPTAVDATSTGVAFASSVTGSVRALDTTGAITFNFSGLRRPLGLQLMPGGSALVAEHDAGRILRVGPSNESRPRLISGELEGPTGLVVVDATKGYVTESGAGRVTRFHLDRFEKSVVARGLDKPEGIALMTDGRLAVVEAGARRLLAVDPDTGRIEVMADNLPIAAPAPGAVAGVMTDVAGSPDGTLFINTAAERGVLKITLRFDTPPGTEAGHGGNPSAVR